MEIVKFKREQEYHKQHVERVRSIKHVINTATPSSLGLKHLASRPKKQQLIDDRQQAIAKENRHLMERMTAILSSKKEIPKYIRNPSLNEAVRRRTVDKMNSENNLLVERLKKVPSVLDIDKLEKDFELHQRIANHLRRRQMIPSNETPSSPGKFKRTNDNSTFDVDLYISQHTGKKVLADAFNQKKANDSIFSSVGEKLVLGSNAFDNSTVLGSSMSDAPIQNMKDFRRQVISQKVLEHSQFKNSLQKSVSSPTRTPKTGGGYELSHDPSSSGA